MSFEWFSVEKMKLNPLKSYLLLNVGCTKEIKLLIQIVENTQKNRKHARMLGYCALRLVIIFTLKTFAEDLRAKLLCCFFSFLLYLPSSNKNLFALENDFKWNIFQPIHSQCTLSLPPENIRKHQFSDVFRGVEKGCIGSEWVNQRFRDCPLNSSSYSKDKNKRSYEKNLLK